MPGYGFEFGEGPGTNYQTVLPTSEPVTGGVLPGENQFSCAWCASYRGAQFDCSKAWSLEILEMPWPIAARWSFVESQTDLENLLSDEAESSSANQETLDQAHATIECTAMA